MRDSVFDACETNQYDMTRGGVVYDLTRTPFIAHHNDIFFHFSSVTHMNKFLDNVVKREEWLNDSFFRRFKFSIDATLIADIQWYTMCETRGFYITDEEGNECSWREEVELDGLILKWKSCEAPLNPIIP